MNLFCFRTVTESRYGRAPSYRIQGHVNATFKYIVPPLDYILAEIIKNAFR